MKVNTQKEDGHVMVEAGTMQPRAKESQRLTLPPEARERHGRILPEGVQSERGHAGTLISDFWPPDLGEDTFLLFSAPQFVVLC